MTSLLKPGLLLAIGSLLAASAQASVYTIGELPLAPSSYSHTATVSGSSFSDSYLFTLSSAAATASASAVSLDLLDVLNIDKLMLQLFDGTGQLLVSASSGDYAALTNYVLSAGQNYSYTVSGDITGNSGGVYTLLATSDEPATNVPEPTSLLLAGMGLLAAGFVSRGRQRRPAPLAA